MYVCMYVLCMIIYYDHDLQWFLSIFLLNSQHLCCLRTNSRGASSLGWTTKWQSKAMFFFFEDGNFDDFNDFPLSFDDFNDFPLSFDDFNDIPRNFDDFIDSPLSFDYFNDFPWKFDDFNDD